MILHDIKVPVDYTDDLLRKQAARQLKVTAQRIRHIEITRRSVDSRRGDVRFSLQLNVTLQGESPETKPPVSLDLPTPKPSSTAPVIIGAGPAGLFCTLALAEAGYHPILIERGQPIQQRRRDVADFQNGQPLNLESNIYFGEGGAGTFSDGKLVTRINDPRCKYVLQQLTRHGAPHDIMVDARPHIGTDLLAEVLIQVRQRIIDAGGQVLFGEKLERILTCSGQVIGIITQHQQIDTNTVILATGHGARDIYHLMDAMHIPMESKAIAVGMRIEHPRDVIDRAVYGQYAQHPRLGAASYTLKAKFNGMNIFSFCMCPGGEVVNASTEGDGLCVNGMSYHARDGVNSNAAIVCQIMPHHWGGDPMKGIDYQRQLERKAFYLSDSTHHAPAQRLADFLADRPTQAFDEVHPTIQPGAVPANLRQLMSADATDAIGQAIQYWERRMTGFSMGGAVLTAIESRTSSPIRIIRDDTFQSPNLLGLYPCGEGAGYAGGIMSTAVDGVRIAQAVAQNKRIDNDQPSQYNG